MSRLNRYDIIFQEKDDNIIIRLVDKIREYESFVYRLSSSTAINIESLKAHSDELSYDVERIVHNNRNICEAITSWIKKYGEI